MHWDDVWALMGTDILGWADARWSSVCVASSVLQVPRRSGALLLKFDSGSLLLAAKFPGCVACTGAGQSGMGLGSRAGCGRLPRPWMKGVASRWTGVVCGRL